MNNVVVAGQVRWEVFHDEGDNHEGDTRKICWQTTSSQRVGRQQAKAAPRLESTEYKKRVWIKILT